MAADFDRDSWEQRWEKALSDNAHAVDQHPPNSDLLATAQGLTPGTALDAGAGHGSEAIWLAENGWQVSAVDFSTTALNHGRTRTERRGAEIAERIDWIEGDLGSWNPRPKSFDLVLCIHVHSAGPVEELVGRLASGVAPGGSLLLVGYQPADVSPDGTKLLTGQNQVTVELAVAALDPTLWEIVVAEERQRSNSAADGTDAVVRAVART